MLPELTGQHLTCNPLKTAVIDGHERWSYVEYDHYVQSIANHLISLGYNGRHKIAIIAKNSAGYFALYLACRRTNNIAVLINWRLPESVQSSLLSQADVSAVYRDNDIANISRDWASSTPSYESDPNADGLFLYTSGTTGEPKAAVITNASRSFLINRLSKLDPGIENGHRICAAPFYHQNGLSTMENTLAGTGTAIVLNEFDPEVYLKLTDQYKTTRLTIIPSMMAMMLDCTNIGQYDFGFVRAIVMATSPVTKNLYDRAKKVFYNANIRVRYGLTEIGPVFGPPPEPLIEPPLTCGYPQPGVEYRLVNSVLHLRSASMSQTFYKQSNPKIVDGWLNTGDLFRIDKDGFYYWVGRADDMYKVGGEQVYPAELESILENISGIKEACVVMLEDDVKGYKPYAFCVGDFNEKLVEAALLNTLPRYKIPRRIWKIDAMPLYGVGKIDRKQLTDRAKELI
jgi:long-chain acyl-CoA synthetase